jgi:hypothetical protein
MRYLDIFVPDKDFVEHILPDLQGETRIQFHFLHVIVSSLPLCR